MPLLMRQDSTTGDRRITVAKGSENTNGENMNAESDETGASHFTTHKVKVPTTSTLEPIMDIITGSTIFNH